MQRDDATAAFQLSLVRNDLFFRVQRAVGLIPATGLGIGRRALSLALVTFGPIAVWAAFANRALPGAATSEPLFQHFGVTVRCLVAIPLLVIAEGVAHAMTTRLLPHFASSGLVTLLTELAERTSSVATRSSQASDLRAAADIPVTRATVFAQCR
jgi:hypothetical protein